MSDTDAIALAIEIQKEADTQARSSARISALTERLVLCLRPASKPAQPRESFPPLRLLELPEDDGGLQD